MRFFLILVLGLSVLNTPVLAGSAKVVDAEVTLGGGGLYRFSVTLRHDDAGWDHYADRWDVLAPDGKVLGKRVLMHPHDNEQPFKGNFFSRLSNLLFSLLYSTLQSDLRLHGRLRIGF